MSIYDSVSFAPKIEEFQLLFEVACTLGRLNDTNDVLQCLVRSSQRYFQSEAASIVWLEPDGTQVFRAVEGHHSGEILGLRFPKGEGLSGWVAEHGESLWIPDVSKDSRFFDGVDKRTGFKTRSILAGPITKTDTIVAILEVVNPSSSIDGERAKFLLAELTALTADALDRCDLMTQAFRYQHVFETCVEPGLFITQTGYLCDVNRTARSVFHIEEDQCADKHFDSLNISDVAFRELIRQIKTKDGISWDFALDDGEQRTYNANMILLEVGDTAQYYLSVYDITDFISLEDSRMQLFNMLVHDLRVPLGSIHHSIELVMAAWNEKDVSIPVDQVLEIALRSEHRMERLISDILDTTLLDSQSKTLEVTSINISELVKDVVNIVESSARRRNHSLGTMLESKTGVFHGDLDLLQRVLINILSNAVKYTPDGGEINIVVYDDDQNVYFEVRDNGPGILPSDEEHIFDLFYRGTSNRIKGAGIGLAFSKLAIEAHNGTIWLDREVDKGAKFVFYIPKQLPESAIFVQE